MGNKMAAEARYDLVSIFDIASMILDGKMPASIIVPVCLDELVDWTHEAMITSNRLARSGAQVFPEDCDEFVLVQPFLRRVAADGKVGSDEIVRQKDVTHVPSSTFERTAFFDKQILIYIEAVDPNRFNRTHAASSRVVYSLSGLDFCIYMRLLRRLSQLSDLNGSISRENSCHKTEPEEADNLCKICMACPEDTVLPCLHGMCSSCEEKWVETHMDCPFCRMRYMNQRRRRREQWQLENWRIDEVEKDMIALEQQVQSFWKERTCSKPIGIKEMDGFARLERSFNETIVDDNFVLLH